MHRQLGGDVGLSGCSSFCSLTARLLQPADRPTRVAAADQQPPAEKGRAAAAAYLVPVTLPITGTVDTHVKRRIDQILAELPAGDARPVLILEYRVTEEQSADASEFERCLSLARYLASDRLARVRTVAYLPVSVKGHAVLTVIACEEIIIDPDAVLGEAGIGEPYVDATVLRGYSEIAERRRTVPVAVVLGMLNKDLSVHRVQTLDGIRYVLGSELEELKRTTTVSSIESVVQEGDLAGITGRDLRLKYGFASHLRAIEPISLPHCRFRRARSKKIHRWAAIGTPCGSTSADRSATNRSTGSNAASVSNWRPNASISCVCRLTVLGGRSPPVCGWPTTLPVLIPAKSARWRSCGRRRGLTQP